jgi:hypothetical protein
MNKATSTEVPDLFVYANDLYTRFAHSERTRGWVGWVARSAWKRHWAQVAHTQSFHATPSSLNALEAQGVHRNFHDLTATQATSRICIRGLRWFTRAQLTGGGGVFAVSCSRISGILAEEIPCPHHLLSPTSYSIPVPTNSRIQIGPRPPYYHIDIW